MKKTLGIFAALAGLAIVLSMAEETAARALQFSPETQTPSLFYDEARTVYLGNLERRNVGLGPLRWNKEMTLAARWFSWDSVENRPGGFCGHDDTLGRAPWDRTAIFGYPGFGGAENAYCGYMTPEDAIAGWMNSPGHHDNLLTPGWREIGLGYYRQGTDGRGYITQDFGSDGVYPPLVIQNEAPNTTNPQVDLYIYNTEGSGGLTDIGPAVNMMVSNNACFIGASWQPYQTEPNWTLPSGDGWKTVYSRLRDGLGRTLTASDSIYLGANLPTSELSFNQLSQNSSQMTLYNLNGNGLPKAQFSLGWIGDDQNSNFNKWWGNGERVIDSAATGGTAYRMFPGNGETMAWIAQWGFLPGNNNFVAYFRLKTNNNSTSAQVARVKVATNGNDAFAQEMVIHGSDFQAAGQYQEFAYPFTYNSAASDQWLTFYIWGSGDADIYFDEVTIFTASQTLSGPTYTWDVPGGHYRGQGVWVRYADDSGAFSGFQEAQTISIFNASAQQINHLALSGQTSKHQLLSIATCDGSAWSVTSKPAWLQTIKAANSLDVFGNASGMGPGTYQGNLVLNMSSTGASITIPARLTVVNRIYSLFLPAVRR